MDAIWDPDDVGRGQKPTLLQRGSCSLKLSGDAWPAESPVQTHEKAVASITHLRARTPSSCLLLARGPLLCHL